VGNYEKEWGMLRAAEAARRALGADLRAIEVLDLALFNVLRMKERPPRRFDALRTATLPARAAVRAWRVPRRAPAAEAQFPSSGRRIVFCVWTTSHVKHLVPVARVLAASGAAAPLFLVLRDATLIERVRDAGLPVRWGEPDVSRRERLDAVAAFARRVPAALRVAKELGNGKADSMLVDTVLFAVAGVTPLELLARRFLTSFRPSAIVLANHEMAVGRMLAQLAGEQGIPLIQVQHGFIARHPKHAWPHAGTTCVWGNQTKALLESLGWPGGKISVCGAPGLDHLSQLERPSKPATARRVVLYTPVSGNSLTPAADVEAATQALYGALATRSDVELVVKPHPVDRLHIPERLLKSFPALRATVVRNGDLHRMMLDADVVTTMWSTTALEAVLLERPVVVIDSKQDDPLPIVEYGAALKAGRSEAVAAALESAFGQAGAAALARGRARFSAEFAHGNDGRAAERTAEVVLRAT